MIRWVSVPTGASTVATTPVPWVSVSRAACKPMVAVPAALSTSNRFTSTTKVYGEPSGRWATTVSPVSTCSMGS